jgi:SAM-dependent methyltransferase
MDAEPSTQAAAFTRTVARYRSGGRFAHNYVRGKLRRDPAYARIMALGREAPLGAVLDAGCGGGQLGVALLEAGFATSVLGFDINPALLARATRASEGLPMRVEARDLSRPGALPACDTLLLIDVLYQLETAAQAALLEAAAASARRMIVIRTADPARGWRSLLTRTLERMTRRVWPHAGATVNARPPSAMAATLSARGFACELAPCWTGTPFANVILIARRDYAADFSST